VIRKLEFIADGVEEWRGGVSGNCVGWTSTIFDACEEKKTKRQIAATRPTVSRPMLPSRITIQFLSRAMAIDSG
jgi:hypothetical protein